MPFLCFEMESREEMCDPTMISPLLLGSFALKLKFEIGVDGNGTVLCFEMESCEEMCDPTISL